MMVREEWNKLCLDIETILDAYVVANNLSTDDDRVTVELKFDSEHYVSWAVVRKMTLIANHKFNADCITISIDIFNDEGITISVDEYNCGINIKYDYPGLLTYKHIKSSNTSNPGESIYIFKTKDLDLLSLIIATLDKSVSV